MTTIAEEIEHELGPHFLAFQRKLQLVIEHVEQMVKEQEEWAQARRGMLAPTKEEQQ